MKTYRLLSIVLALVVVISVLSIWFKSSVQDYMEGNRQWSGLKDLVAEFNPVALDSLGSLDSVPTGATLLAVPTTGYSLDDLDRMVRFVDNGGTLLLMNDFGYGNDILNHFKMDVRFARGVLLDPLFCYKNQELPRILFFAPALTADGISAVTFNRGTSLTGADGGEVLAASSDLSFLDLDDNGKWDNDEPKGPLVVSAKFHVNDGYVVLVADPSILINSMIGMDDNTGFMRYLIADKADSGRLYIDRSHLIETPLDIAKIFLAAARKNLSNPYAAIGALVLLFVLVSLNVARKEHQND